MPNKLHIFIFDPPGEVNPQLRSLFVDWIFPCWLDAALEKLDCANDELLIIFILENRKLLVVIGVHDFGNVRVGNLAPGLVETYHVAEAGYFVHLALPVRSLVKVSIYKLNIFPQNPSLISVETKVLLLLLR